MLHRAYSFIELKQASQGDGRTFLGTATSPVPDRLGDVIASSGVTFKNPLPLLLYHNSQKPVGEVRMGRPGPNGTPFEARISSIDRPGAVADRINEALDSLHADPPLIRAVSIGFRAMEPPTYNKETDGYTFEKIEVLELSMVVIPAHQNATIDAVKSFDISDRDLAGLKGKDMASMMAACRACRVTLAACIAACQALKNDPVVGKAVTACADACAACDAACAACLSADAGAQMMIACAACASACDACADVCEACAAACGSTPKYAACAAACAACEATCATCETECQSMAVMPPMKAALGHQKTHVPGVSGSSRVTTRTRTTMKKSFADRIKEFEATRAAKMARMDEILAKDDGTTTDEAEAQEHDDLEADVRKIDADLVRLRAAEKREKEEATEVADVTGLRAREDARIRVVNPVLPKGIAFARYALCIAHSRGMAGEAIRLAKEHYPNDIPVQKLVEKTAVAGASTSGSHYIDDLIPYNVMNDFIEYLRPGSIIGKFGGPNPGGGANYPSLNRVGFNERVSGMSTGFTAGWKGEGLPALPSAAVTFNQSLTWNCMAALAVMTKEAVRFSNPNAESRVRDDLARAVNQKLDNDFIDPAKAASGTTSPASITNAVVATAVSGTAATNVRHDIAVLMAAFAANNLDPSDVVFIMSGSIAAQLAMMVNTLGQRDFPDVTFNGGTIAGRPVIVSELLTALGSPSTQMIVAVKASEVYLADDGVVTVEASDQASIEMVDTSSQSGISGTGASLVSLWQSGLIGLMANREITWKLRRSTAVQYLSPVAYAVPTS